RPSPSEIPRGRIITVITSVISSWKRGDKLHHLSVKADRGWYFLKVKFADTLNTNRASPTPTVILRNDINKAFTANISVFFNDAVKRVQRLSQDNRIKQRRVWLLLGCVTVERSCPCKQPACPAVGGGSEVTFKPLVPRLSVREGFLALNSPGKIKPLYFTLLLLTCHF
ncbi:hypothetical protein J6590_084349, partial [Homalodisca vitripennis]